MIEPGSELRRTCPVGSEGDRERLVERATEVHGASGPTFANEILVLADAVEAHHRGTRGHSERVSVITDMIAERLGLPIEDRDRLRWAALLHDVGKVAVPRAVLLKDGAPTREEWESLELHPSAGARLTETFCPWLGGWAAVIEQHHERWDGRGYPNGIAGADISLGARIVAVADSYETMTSRRSYREPLRASRARAELQDCAGAQFDPEIVDAFLSISVRRFEESGSAVPLLAHVPLIRAEHAPLAYRLQAQV